MSDLANTKKLAKKRNLNQVTTSNTSQSLTEPISRFGEAKKLANLESLLNNLSEAIIEFDLNLNAIGLNKAGKHVSKNFKTFQHDGKDYRLSELLIIREVLISNANLVSPIEAVSFDRFGVKHIFTIGASPVFSETAALIGVCLIITDITKSHKEAGKLEDLIGGLTHDLKTPLVAAGLNLRHLLDGFFGDITDKQKQILSLLSQNNTDALRLVKNLLAVFKYETKLRKLLLEQVEVSKLLKQVLDSVNPMLEEKNIYLQVTQTNFQFVCDSFEIERVIVNLLINAITVTPRNGRIELRASKNEEGTIMFIIEDFGKGISVEELPNLFKRFWQSRRTSSNTGLGLYLSKQVVEAHGGRIWAESKLGEWTRIIFEIPELV